jgi:hypothetical protein
LVTGGRLGVFAKVAAQARIVVARVADEDLQEVDNVVEVCNPTMRAASPLPAFSFVLLRGHASVLTVPVIPNLFQSPAHTG